MKRKLLAIVVAMLMVCTMIPSMAFADDTTGNLGLDAGVYGSSYITQAYADTFGYQDMKVTNPYVAVNFSITDYTCKYDGVEAYIYNEETKQYEKAIIIDDRELNDPMKEVESISFNKDYEMYDSELGEWVTTNEVQYSSTWGYIKVGCDKIGKTMKFRFLPYNEGKEGKTYGDYTEPSEAKIEFDSYAYAVCVAATKLKVTASSIGVAADKYYIYRYNSKSKKYEKIKTIDGKKSEYGAVTFTDTNLAKKTKYRYKVAFSVALPNGKIYTSKKSDMYEAKTSPNEYTREADTTNAYMNEHDGNVALQETKVWYADGKLNMKFLVMNCKTENVNKFKWIRISVYDYQGGTLIAQQKFTDRKVDLDQYDFKNMSFEFSTGTKKTNINLRDSSVYWEAQWSTVTG